MSEPGGFDAAALLKRYQAEFDVYEVDYVVVDEASLAFPGDAEFGVCDGALTCEDLETGDAVEGEAPMVLVQVFFAPPFESVPAARREWLYALLAHVTPEVPLGHFEFSAGDRRLRYRAAYTLPAIEVPGPALMAPIIEGLSIVEDWYVAFRRVLVDGEHPGHVFVETQLDRYDAEGETIGNVERARLIELLRDAGGAYRAAGQSERKAQLGELIQRAATP